MTDMEGLKEVPLRRDGTPKVFFYDPDFPYHIMHNTEDGVVRAICCMGHDHR